MIATATALVRTPMGVYVLRDDTCLSRWIEAAQMLTIPADLAQVAQIAHLIPEGSVIVEAGACLGDHTALYSQIVGWTGQVYAFEPHPESYEALLKNTSRFRNVTTLACALSDVTGKAALVPSENVGASYLGDSGVPVWTVTLDTYLRPKLIRCDLLHLDAEGAEPAILRGAAQLIAQFHPAILTEVSDAWLRRAGSSEVAYLAQLTTLGYRVTRLDGPERSEYDALAVWEEA